MTHRVQRVRELIRRELGTILERHFSFSGCLVTIHDVDLPPDLKQCFIYVSIFGDGEPHDGIVKRLNEKKGAIQKDLFKRVILKSSPSLFFRSTDAIERGVRVLNIIESLPEIPDEPEPEESEEVESANLEAETEVEPDLESEDELEVEPEPAKEVKPAKGKGRGRLRGRIDRDDD